MRFVSVALIALAPVAMIGCGEDEPSPKAPPTEAAPVSASPEGGVDEGKDKTTTPTPSTSRGAPAPKATDPSPADPKVAKVVTPPAPSVVAPALPSASTDPVAPLVPVSLASLPEGVTAVLGLASLRQQVSAFGEAARLFGADMPVPSLEASLAQLEDRFGLKSAQWIDTERPLIILIPDPKRYDNGFLATVPFKGKRDDVIQGIGPLWGQAPTHDGKIVAGGVTLFMDFDGNDRLWVSTHHELEELLGAFAVKLRSWTPPSPVVLEVHVGHLRKVYAQELAVARLAVDQLSRRLAGRAGSMVQVETMKTAISATFQFVDSAERIGFALDPRGGELRAAFGLRAADGTGLSKMLNALSGRTAGLADTVSADAWFAMVSNLPPGLADISPETLAAQVKQGGLSITDEQVKQLAGHFAILLEAGTGDNVWSIRQDGAFPAALESLSLVTDGTKARAALYGVFEIIFAQMLERARQEAGTEGPGALLAKVKTFGEAVELGGALLQPMGIGVTATEVVEGDVRVGTVAVTVDWDKTGLSGVDPELFAFIRAFVGERIEISVAASKGALALALGPNGKARAVALAHGDKASPASGIVHAAKGQAAAAALRAGALLEVLSRSPRLAALREAISALPKDEAFVVQARGDHGTLTLTGTLPIALFKGLMNLRPAMK